MDEFRFLVPLRFTQDAGEETVDVTVRFQACTRATCLEPRTMQVHLPVMARRREE